jgi:CheY-like chemotaxis protein
MTKKILLVEDHDHLRKLMGFLLSAHYDIIAARNGLEAMSILSRGIIPDAIVTDSRMPEMNAAQLLKNLRCSGMFAHIPVIVIGDATTAHDTQAFYDLGVQGLLQKPFKPQQLQDMLHRAVQQPLSVCA